MLGLSVFAMSLAACGEVSNSTAVPSTAASTMSHAKTPSFLQQNNCGNTESCAGCTGGTGDAACGNSGSSGSSGGGGGPTGPTSSTPCDPTVSQCPTQVSCVGTTSQCKGIPCWGSPGTIGDLLPDSTASKPDTVKDMNSLWSGNTEEGWLYESSSGQTWIQFNYASKATWNASFNAFFLGFGVNPMGAYSAVMPFSGQWPSSSAVPVKCETQGQQFQSGTQWA